MTHRKVKRIRVIWVKNLVRPEEHYHLSVSKVFYMMSISRWDVNHLDLFARDMIFNDIIVEYIAKSDNRTPLYYTELLDLAVMIVVTPSNPLVGLRKEYLPEMIGLDQLKKRTSVVSLEI